MQSTPHLETEMAEKLEEAWQSTACILCTCNCGLKVQLNEDGTDIARIKGDDEHPASRGYVCNKASRIGFYQNNADRLSSPMRRKPDGTYEAVDWDTALSEVAARLLAVREAHGGDKIFYYGGGGQGNHLAGGYARATNAVLGVQWRSNALAQEKTGEFWVAERMFGGWPHGDFEHAQVAIFLGKNPWQSHGIQRARATLREIAKDPDRTLIVIDPKRTETADLADIHLAVKPARDAWLLAGLVAVIVQENLVNEAWVEANAQGLEEVRQTFAQMDIERCAELCGIDTEIIRSTARLIAKADSVAMFEDLGVQMNRNSTLVSYLQRLVWILCGHFGRDGTHYTVNPLANIATGTETGVSPVLGERMIAGLVPCNAIADEVLADHPNRYRAMIIESANPVHSLADSPRWREAMKALEFSVVIDVAMTETARHADYVLPTTSQYEKAEATFFNLEFPDNYFHVRKPLFKPREGVLDEGEIHARLVEHMGAWPEDAADKLTQSLEEGGRDAFRDAVFALLSEDPNLLPVASVVLYRVLGATLPQGMRNAAALWAISHQHAVANRDSMESAGLQGEGMALGEALFDAMVSEHSGFVFSTENWDDVWGRLPDARVKLALPELLAEAKSLAQREPAETNEEFPLLLAAGERRAFTANTIIRDPAWRRKDGEGALFIHPDDAAKLNLGENSRATISSQRGSLQVVVELNDRMQPGHVSLPNGMGLDYPGDDASPVGGVAPNELTSSELRDEYVGTPWHKSVPVRVEPH